MDRTLISCQEAIAQIDEFDAIIDVRSESEFALDHLPGAMNYPVLNDRERAEIGTQYKQESVFAARCRGAALVARNIALHLEQSFASQPRDWKPLVYCWRGGQRSASMTHVMKRIGWQAWQLDGGYREFRRFVVQALAELPSRFEFRVICGTTGSGKSRLLRELRSAGGQVLDLEELANHRGSVLGGFQDPQPTQKRFETSLWWHLRGFDIAHPVFVESESRKVGDLRVPDGLIERMRASSCLQLELPREERVRLLREEYRHLEQDRTLLFRQLDCLVPLHGAAKVQAWKQLAEGDEWPELVERLLGEHYDPGYLRSIGRNYSQATGAAVIQVSGAGDFACIARELVQA
jgi:tRNA 2-selenouridine synthase